MLREYDPDLRIFEKVQIGPRNLGRADQIFSKIMPPRGKRRAAMWRTFGMEMQEDVVAIIHILEGDQLRRDVAAPILAEPHLYRTSVPKRTMRDDLGALFFGVG